MSPLPEFRAALVQHPEALSELSDDSLLRYTRGELPRVLRWMMRYPALLHALARDAEQLQHDDSASHDPAAYLRHVAKVRTSTDRCGHGETPVR